jgi:hypothetical protein
MDMYCMKGDYEQIRAQLRGELHRSGSWKEDAARPDQASFTRGDEMVALAVGRIYWRQKGVKPRLQDVKGLVCVSHMRPRNWSDRAMQWLTRKPDMNMFVPPANPTAKEELVFVGPLIGSYDDKSGKTTLDYDKVEVSAVMDTR